MKLLILISSLTTFGLFNAAAKSCKPQKAPVQCFNQILQEERYKHSNLDTTDDSFQYELRMYVDRKMHPQPKILPKASLKKVMFPLLAPLLNKP